MPTRLERLESRKNRRMVIAFADDYLPTRRETLRARLEKTQKHRLPRRTSMTWTDAEVNNYRARQAIAKRLDQISLEMELRRLEEAERERIRKGREIRPKLLARSIALANSDDSLTKRVGLFSHSILRRLTDNYNITNHLETEDYSRRANSLRFSVGEGQEKVRVIFMDDGSIAAVYNPLTPKAQRAAKDTFEALWLEKNEKVNAHVIGFASIAGEDDEISLAPFVMVRDSDRPIPGTNRFAWKQLVLEDFHPGIPELRKMVRNILSPDAPIGLMTNHGIQTTALYVA